MTTQLHIINPATEGVVTFVDMRSLDETDRAIELAAKTVKS